MKRSLVHAAAAALTLSALAAASGCATATGDVAGGDARFNALGPSNIDAGPLSPGNSWQELYADYFGNPGRAACAGTGACHGAANQSGAQNSQFICAENDRKGCHDSMVSTTTMLIAPNDPAHSTLLTSVLRHADGSSGNMPKSPAYGFTTTDLQRISAWIAAGALNDDAAEIPDAGQLHDAGAD
ncbi:MAG: hypothetical protein ABI461_12965 [Polyangiaceae bacterium]